MNIKHLSSGLLLLAATATALPAVAQEDVTYIEEIKVTATKREQTLQEVPIAVSVISAEAIADSQILDVKDLQFLVPSLKIGQLQTTGNTNFRIRGFGNGANNAGVEPSVGVFIDGVYRSRSASALADLPNLERVEVLRGPQSTLFGKNASAGIINVVTAKPSLDFFEGSVTATIGDYNQTMLKGDVTGPFSDKAGFSLSGSYNKRDGYFDNLYTGGTVNELNRYGVRGQLYFVPSDTLELRIIADFEKMDEACCAVANLFEHPVPAAGIRLAPVFNGLPPGNLVSAEPFAYANYYNWDPENEVENSGLSGQLEWDINDNVTLTSITAYRNHDRFDNVDSDFSSAQLLSRVASNLIDSEIDTFTQEFRFQGGTDSMTWMAGLYYFDEEISTRSGVLYGADYRQYANVFTKALGWEAGCALNPDPQICNEQFLLALLSDPQIPSPIDSLEAALALPAGTLVGELQGNDERSGMDNKAMSIFAQFDFDLSDRATLTLGASYTEDEKDAFVNIVTSDIFSSLSMEQIGFGLAFQGLTGLAPTAANIAANPGEAQLASQWSVTDCSPTSLPPACNQLLPLQAAQFLPPFVNFPNAVESGSTKDDQATWTVRLAFDVNDSINVYASAGTGFKASSWNLSRDSRPFAGDIAALEQAGLSVTNLVSGSRFAEPEESTVYELGLKSKWDSGTFNIAVFSQEIAGFQSNLFTGTGFSLANAGKQSTDGIEADLVWYPIEAFQLTVGATWLDPVYDSFVGAEGVNGPEDLSGTKPPGIHEISIVTSGQYNFGFTDTSSGFVRVEYLYEDEVPLVENVPASLAMREVSEVNASFGIRWDNGFEAMLWGRNLTDDQYLISAFPATVQPGSFNGYPNQPRTYGLTVRKIFD